MTIAWTKCSERMPPDCIDSRYLFINLEYHNAIPLIYSGHTVNMLGHIKGDAWMPYTPEAWAELNRK